MKYLLFILFTLSSFAQESINQMNAQGKRTGVWKGTYETTKRPKYEGTFENGIEVGTFSYFTDTKTKRLFATREFSENGTKAYTIFYDEKKNKVSEGITVNKLKEGEWKYYHKSSSVIMTIENYSKGKLNGVRKVFFNDGKIAEEATYLNDKKHGSYKSYTEKGTILEASNYANGKLHGYAIFRDGGGNLASEGNYKDDAKDGVWKFYKKGKFDKEETFPKVTYIKKKNVPKL